MNLETKKVGLRAGKSILLLFFLFTTLTIYTNQQALAQTNPNQISLNLPNIDSDDSIVPALKIVILLTILSVAPAILLMMTSFTRILIVLSFIRLALGTQTMPPNQVIVGLSLFLTMFTMSPVWEKVDAGAVKPYLAQLMSRDTAIDNAIKPVHQFMMSQTRGDDLNLFYQVSKKEIPTDETAVPLSVLMPAFMISELKTAFEIGFLIYIPFLIIDMVISSILMAMGMMMLPPTVVSLPFKLVLFVLVDGWSLIVNSLVKSFQGL
ncbi:MAG: flagellar type III secretion system pore protein FliP [Oligoflexales bacterium]|nr:flagellar type III secretion system pore protein FliP [Oligoflexales bacterium]